MNDPVPSREPPGGRLWLVKWLLVAALAGLVLLLVLGGGPSGA